MQEVEDRFEKVGIRLPLKKKNIQDAQDNFDSWSASMTENANKLSPLYVLNEQTKVGSWLLDGEKHHWLRRIDIWFAFISARI